MEQISTTDVISAIFAKDTWTAEDYGELLKQLPHTTPEGRKVQTLLLEADAANPSPKGATAVKAGIIRYMLCRFSKALEAFTDATDNKDRRYFQALCYKSLFQYDKAQEELERAKARGFDEVEIDLELAEAKALAGAVQEAHTLLSKREGKAGASAKFLYVRGLIDELSGWGERAAQAYAKARTVDPDFSPATFRLAYTCDLHGDDEQAIKLYKECLSHPPVYANALLNLVVIYEDLGQYDKAVNCLHRLLAVQPDHARARLFLKDVKASRTMYYDEDQAKRIARRNAVLEIPVSDFELSVRARNCLKKMNIRTLGDLVRTTEAELLGYKNFGETSLKEIKDMLSAKGLRLGQALEETDLQMGRGDAQAVRARNEGILATPVEQIEFSVRVRKALESLRVATLGQLIGKTEADLLACKNFGQTSLNEVRQRLAEYGLRLREAN
jgi:DNA-directed RNA polymerase subunit alpha